MYWRNCLWYKKMKKGRIKMMNNSDVYSWFNELTPEQFSKAYALHQALVQQKRMYSNKRRKFNRKWWKWYLKYLNSLTYDTVLDYCRNDVMATTNISEAVNYG